MSWRRLLVALVIGAGVFALAGYVLAPAIVGHGLKNAIARHTGADVTVGSVKVNPLSLTVLVDDVAISRPDGAARAHVTRLRWRHPLSYLFTPGWSVAELTLEAPRLSVQATSDWRAGAVAALSLETALKIARLTVTDGQFRVVDGDVSRWSVGALRLDGQDLGTGADRAGAITLAGTLDQGGKVSAKGSLSLAPVALRANVTVSGVDVGGLAISETTTSGGGVVLASSVLSGDAQVRLDQDDLHILGDFSLGQVSLVDGATGTRVFSADRLSGSGVAVRPAPLSVSAKTLQVAGAQFDIARGADGRWSGADWLYPLLGGPASVFPSTERIEWIDGRMTFADFAATPPVQLAAKNIRGTVGTVRSGSVVSVTMQGQLAGIGSSRLNASWPTANPNRSGTWLLTVSDLDATHLSSYLASVAGRSVAAGNLDLSMKGSVTEGLVNIANKISVSGLELGEPPSTPVENALPLDLAVALVEDPGGTVSVDVPLPAIRPGQAPPLAPFRVALEAVISELADRPFDVLAGLVDAAGSDLGNVVFDPGSAAPGEAASQTLAMLASALAQRPRLGAVITGRYDRQADRAALARQQIDLHIALATSAGPPGGAAPAPLDLTNPRITSVLEEFATERLGTRTLAAIRARWPASEPGHYGALYEALVANETVSERALKSLARFRAQSVARELGTAELDSERIRVSTAVEEVDTGNEVISLPIELWHLPGRTRSVGSSGDAAAADKEDTKT